MRGRTGSHEIALPATSSVPGGIELQTDLSPIELFAVLRSALPGVQAALLESSALDPHLGRYSYVAFDPVTSLVHQAGACYLRARGEGRWKPVSDDPFRAVSRLVARGSRATAPELPPFQGGVIGYFGYDLSRGIERLPETTVDDLHLPDLAVGLYEWVIAYDHARGRAWLVSAADSQTPEQATKLDSIRRIAEAPAGSAHLPPAALPQRTRVESTFTRDEYLKVVQQAIEYIRAGDIYQVCLSQRLSANIGTDAFDQYQRLRAASPAPYGACLEYGGFALASISPELFLRLSGRTVETRPIKGTRPRGANPLADAALVAELAASTKDRAENLMIVDLLRNDIGRVCETGSVHVPSLFDIESHATVHHMVSVVRGQLRPEMNPVDLLRACFPGGSVTGCPKIRAMEIIDELEPTRRGPYCGAIGFIGFDGAMDTSIAIRTAVVTGNSTHFQVGGAVVADSDPDDEYQETLDKGRAFLTACNAEPPDPTWDRHG